MANKEVVYRARFDLSKARAEARAFRAGIEAELRTIKMGTLDTTSFQRATSEAQRLRFELEQAAKAANDVRVPAASSGPRPPTPSASAGGGLGGLAGGVLAGAGVTLAVRQLQELGREMEELGRRGAVFSQLKDVLNSYAASVGSSADRMIAAAQKAAMGTISQYELILNANRALQFQVAKTPEQFAKLIELSTALGRAQGIGDTQALEFITTGIARESKLILDNLGLIINMKEAQANYAQELGKTADQLSQAEKKQAILAEAYKQGATAIEANRAAADSAATTFERFDTAVQDAKDAFGELIADMSKGVIGAMATEIAELTNAMVVYAKGTSSSSTELETFLQTLIKNTKAVQDAKEGKGGIPILSNLVSKQDTSVEQGYQIAAQRALDSLAKVNAALDAGLPGAAKYEADFKNIVNALIDGSMSAPEVVSNLMKIEAELTALSSNPQALAAAAEQKRLTDEKAAQVERLKLLSEQEMAVDEAIRGRAQKAIETVGADQAIQLYRQAKEQAEAALQALSQDASVDAEEMGFKVQEIISSLTEQIAAAEEAARTAVSTEEIAAGFDRLQIGLEGINAGFTDFLPGVAGVREELISLSTELAFTGAMTDEQAAALEYYNGVAAAVADDTSLLGQVTAELGEDFLASNEYAAALVDQLYQAEGAYRAGLITADVYAGIVAVLSGRLMTVAGAANVATGAIASLNSSMGGRASAAGLRAGGQVADRVQTQQAAREREANRREAERVARDQERAAKRAASEQERAAKSAGRTLEQAAKKAAQELENALKSVPGLFGTTQVTEEDMKKAELGNYTEKADEYLRRLRDEVENGTDWADVSIEDAKAALERVGIKAGDSAKAILDAFSTAWEDSSLFSDKANLSFINEEAVKLQQDLAEKRKQGEKNILEHFGVVVDEAIDAATGGGGGGADVEIEPASFQNSAAMVEESIKKGADELIKKAALSVDESFKQRASQGGFVATFDQAMGKGNAVGFVGPMPNEIKLTADDKVAAIAGHLTPKAGSSATQGPSLQPILPPDAANKMALDLGDQLSKQTEIFKSHGQNIGTIIAGGISAAMSVNAKGEAQVDIAGFIAGNLSAQYKTLEAQGTAIAGVIMGGLSQSSTSKSAEGGQDTSAMSGLITNINTQIRASTEGFKAQGATVAQIIIAGIVASFKGGGQSAAAAASGESASPMAEALLTALTTQMSTIQNMFYAVGILPAGFVQEGFKGYEYSGLADSFRDALTVGIRTISADLNQRGGTMASYVQNGFVSSFNGEGFKTQLIAIGELMYTYIEMGILAKVNGGKLTEVIGAKVIEDLNAELEKP